MSEKGTVNAALRSMLDEVIAAHRALAQVRCLLPDPKLFAEERWQFRHAQRLSRTATESAVDIFRRARIEPRTFGEEPVDLARER